MAYNDLPTSAASTIAAYHIGDPRHLHVEVGQALHRIHLANQWRIPRGSRILEIGCGQGTCTAVLAEVAGPEGHVDAVDPGAPDYGAPYTLAQAQKHLVGGPIGERITWHNDDPVHFLNSTKGKSWDFAVLAHCIWYFDTQDTLNSLLTTLKGRVKNVLVAEYALKASDPAAQPHVLAAVTRATLEAHNRMTQQNIRCLLSPAAIKGSATQTSWTLEAESEVVPDESLLDGYWEVSAVESSQTSWKKEIVDAGIDDPRVIAVLQSSRDAVAYSVEGLGGKKVKTMDVWVARFG